MKQMIKMQNNLKNSNKFLKFLARQKLKKTELLKSI